MICLCYSKVIKPEISDEPAVDLNFKNKKIVIQYIVSSAVPPSAEWFLNGKPINKVGRYAMDITPQGDSYLVSIQVDRVSYILSCNLQIYKCIFI